MVYGDTRIPNEIVKEWHPTKNSLKPGEVTIGSKAKIWWLGECGHEWLSNIRNRVVKGNKCPVCQNVMLLTGYNDLATLSPSVASEWHPVKNKHTANTVLAGTTQKAWWLGKCGHEWEASVRRRYNGAACPVCLNRLIIIGVNDLATTYPQLASEWGAENVISPTVITAANRTPFWWICDKQHIWKDSPYNRISKTKMFKSCPFCLGYKVWQGFNDLATTHPDIAAQWNPVKNNSHPSDVLPGTHISVWWQCRLGHEWKTAVVHRTGVNSTGCPVCTNRKIVAGFNDLATTHPHLVAEWNQSKNKKMPQEVGPGYIYKVWWLGRCGHEWQSIVKNRAAGQSCPQCSQGITSKVESAFRNYFAKHLNLTRSDHLAKIQLGIQQKASQIDILGTYKNNLRVVIEYDGSYYHSSRAKNEKDYAVTEALLQRDYLVVRIRENPLELLNLNHQNLLQVNYTWSLKPSKIEAKSNEILKWLENLHHKTLSDTL